MKLRDLIEEANRQALRRLEETGLIAGYSTEEQSEIARLVGLAAIKFADLSNDRLSSYVFELDRFTKFEGRTGPYLQYAAVRINSLLRKAAIGGSKPGKLLRPSSNVSRELMLTLNQLPDVVCNAWVRRSPNELCDFSFMLAQVFSRFYSICRVIDAPNEAERASHLTLAELTYRELSLLLNLLGIDIPNRM
jgi:arginyl-tRNA synthetase